MEHLKWERVNKCETVEELKQCILDFADEDGMIQGRTRKFEAKKMVIGLENYINNHSIPNVITRDYGLRQQAMYLKYYISLDE